MNLWNKKGVPHKDWKPVSVEDEGDDRFSCDMCGRTEVRWAHYMTHNNYNEIIKVGCVCAEKLVEGYDGVTAEKLAKKKASWLKKWDNEIVENIICSEKNYKGKKITVFNRNNEYYWHIASKEVEYSNIFSKPKNSYDDALLDVWTVYKEAGWL